MRLDFVTAFLGRRGLIDDSWYQAKTARDKMRSNWDVPAKNDALR